MAILFIPGSMHEACRNAWQSVDSDDLSSVAKRVFGVDPEGINARPPKPRRRREGVVA